MEVVVMPCLKRPEMLALALERLDRAELAPDDVRIYVDTASESLLEEVEWVRDRFLPHALIFHAKPHLVAPSGTFNILQALKSGYETGAERVWLMEEDVLASKSLFTWGRAQLASGRYLAVCGRRDRNHYPIYGPLYTNPGSVLTRELLTEVVKHIKNEYFEGLRGYLDAQFGSWDTQSNLDDGLVRRIVRQMGGTCAYPELPMCAHIGFNFYRMLDIYTNDGNIEQRIQGLRQMLKKIKPTDRYATDFELLPQ